VTNNSGIQGGKALVKTIETPSDRLHELKKFVDFNPLRG